MRKYLVASTIGIALFLGACQLLLGIEDRPVADAPPRDDASVLEPTRDSGVDAFDPCSSDGVPPAPPEVDASADRDRDLLFAMNHVDFGIDAGLPFGLNLDRRCTCPGESACNRPADAQPMCDEANGVDNATKGVLAGLRFSQVLDESTLNENLDGGGSRALLRLQGYNGEANDPTVTVSIYGSLGVEGPFTGTDKDRWRVDGETVVGGNVEQPTFRTGAWVTNSVLVAPFLDFTLRLGGDKGQSPLITKLSSGYVVARIDPKGTLDGVITGRWDVDSALDSIQAFTILDGSVALCAGNEYFELARSAMCGATDVRTNSAEDGLNRPCNALSVHLGFSAGLASFGSVRQRTDSGIAPCPTHPTCKR